jgi:hypothetical protein
MASQKTIVAIDPLAAILPTDVYLIVMEIKHPHVPKVADIRKAIAGMKPEERKAALARTTAMESVVKTVKAELAKAAG